MAASNQAYHLLGRDAIGGRAFTGIQDAEPARGAGADIDQAPTLAKGCRDGIDRPGDFGQQLAHRQRHLLILLIDDAQHLQGRQLVDFDAGRVAGLGNHA